MQNDLHCSRNLAAAPLSIAYTTMQALAANAAITACCAGATPFTAGIATPLIRAAHVFYSTKTVLDRLIASPHLQATTLADLTRAYVDIFTHTPLKRQISMKVLVATTCIAASCSCMALARPLAPRSPGHSSPSFHVATMKPSTPAMSTTTSTQTVTVTIQPISIQRPFLKNTLRGTPPPTDNCRPVCEKASPSGQCIKTVNSCSSLKHSPLSRISHRDRLIALLAAVLAASIDWRLSILLVLGALLPAGRLFPPVVED